MNKTNRTITLEFDVDDYILLLDDRREVVKRNFGWTIPDGVYDYFCEMLEEGFAPGNPSPMYVIDNMAVNGHYCEIEQTELLEKLLDCARGLYANENGGEQIGDDDLPWFVEERKQDLIDSSGILDELFFTYDDTGSDWGIGVCYGL